MAVEPEDEGGDSACWAHVVCPECGAVLADGHRRDCPLRHEPAPGGAAGPAPE